MNMFKNLLLAAVMVCILTVAAVADPGDVLMPDPVLEAAVEAIIGDDGVSGAVDGNWLVGDGGSSAGPGMNDPEGLVELGDLDAFDFPMGVTDLTGLEAASNLGVIILGFGDIQSLAPIANLPGLFGLILINGGVGDAELAELAAGSAAPVALLLMNLDPGATPNSPTTAGINSIGSIGSLMELGVQGTGNELDISGLSGLSLGDIGLGVGLILGGNTITGGWGVIQGFTGLASLSLGDTGMSDAELALIDWSQLSNLTYLDLTVNNISDISPLLGLVGAAAPGLEIDLIGNPLDNDAVCTHIPALEAAGFTVYDNSLPCGSPVLTLTLSGVGEITPAPGTYRYETGTEVFLSATKVSGGGVFSQWNGNVAAPQNMSTSIVMNADEAVEAVFEAGDWTLTVSHSGSGSGTTSVPPGVWAYRNGDFVWLNYELDPGSFWGGWQGDASGIVPTGLVMDSDKIVTAVFGDTGYDLTIATDGPGNTNPAPGTYTLAGGTVLGVEAFITDFTYLFHGWTGDVGAADPGDPNLQVTVDQPRTVTAVFQKPVLTINVTGSGTTTPAAGNHTYDANEFVTLNASADPGWLFSHWEGDASGTNATTGVVMDADRNVTAVFTESPSYSLTVSVVGNGQTQPAAGVHTYDEGAPVTVIATADPGWYFDHWEGDISPGSTSPSLNFNITGNTEVTAVFSQYDWSLTLLVEGQGSLDPPAGVYYYNDGDSQTVAATASPGWGFDRWEGDTEGAGFDFNLNLISIPTDRNRVVTAVFVEINWTLTIELVGAGAPSPAPGQHVYPDGAVVFLFGGWAPGQEAATAFDRWSGDLESTAQYTPITMNADKTVVANYTDADVTLTVQHGGAGSGSTFPSPGVYGFVNGRTTGIPVSSIAPGSYFGGWAGDASGYALTYVIQMNGDKTVTALFETEGYLLTVNSPAGLGSTVPGAGVHPYATGATPTITATPGNTQWLFQRWEGDLGGANPFEAALTVTMDQDRSITPYFVEAAPCDNPSRGGLFRVGDDVCFQVPDPVGPDTSYQWYKDGVPLSNGRVVGATARSLHIPGLQVADSGVYTCTYDDGTKAPATYGPIWVSVGAEVPASRSGGLVLLVSLCALAGAWHIVRRARTALN